MPDSTQRFEFDFDAAYWVAALPFGITPRTAWVTVTPTDLRVRFGPWSLRTSRSNISGATFTGDFTFIKTAGPAHLSFSDRGVSFATNGRRAVCLSFREPVKGIDPTGLIRHPGATLTVADPGALAAALGFPPAGLA